MLDYISFLTYACVTAATPGPNNIMSMANASQFGFRRSFSFNLGVWLGMSLVILLCTVVGNAIYGLLPSIQFPTQVVGAIYMLYLAWKTFTASSDLRQKHIPNLFVSGMLLQFINAKYYVYCLISMQVYIMPHHQGNNPALIFYALLLATIGFLFTVLWAVGGSVLKTLFTQHAKLINTCLALSLVYCAVSLFL